MIPFILMVIIIGLPIFFAELYIGQYSGLGPNKAYGRMSPFFEGLGACTTLVITFVTIYYMVIVAWILFYLFASFTPSLGWGHCHHEYNTHSKTKGLKSYWKTLIQDFVAECYSSLEDVTCKLNNSNAPTDLLYWNQTCVEVGSICAEKGLLGVNASYCRNSETQEDIPIRDVIHRVLASEEYY